MSSDLIAFDLELTRAFNIPLCTFWMLVFSQIEFIIICIEKLFRFITRTEIH